MLHKIKYVKIINDFHKQFNCLRYINLRNVVKNMSVKFAYNCFSGYIVNTIHCLTYMWTP